MGKKKRKPRFNFVDRQVNTKWFRDKMALKGLNQTALGLLINVDRSAMSRILNGGRDISAVEAAELARALDVSIQDVTFHLGGAAPSPAGDRAIRVAAAAGRKGLIEPLKRGMRVETPDGSAGLEGIRIEGTGDAFEGFTAFYQPADRVEPQAVGKLSVAGDTEKEWLGVLRHGSRAGLWNISGVCGSIITENARLEWASPVLWLKA